MNFVVYLFILFITIYLWYQKRYGHRNKLLTQFPAPKYFPILNHSVYVIGKSPPEIFQLLRKFNRELGPVWRFDLNPFISSITIANPKIVEEILTSQKLIDKAIEYDMLDEWLGKGLITSSGNKWHQRRKIITPAFHFKILEQFVDVMERNGDIFVKKLRECNGRRINAFSWISLYALDVICESAMGYKLKAQEDDKSEYVQAVKEMTSIFFQKAFDFKKRIQLYYNLTEMRRREKVVLKKIHDFTYSVIDSRRKHFNECGSIEEMLNQVDEFGVKKKTAFLDLLLQTKIDGVPLDDASIREEVDTFMFAGHDTTTTAISFTLLNLAKYPKIQERVFEECHEILDNKNESDSISIQTYNKMSYLEKVIKESLRLYPSVSTYSRRFCEDVVLGGYTFPANVTIKIAMYDMGRNKDLFPNPTNFDPHRFDDEHNIKLFSYVPFSAGPRNCIGQKFAMLEMKSIISKIINNFCISVDKKDENPDYAQEIILRPVNGIFLRFKSRTELSGEYENSVK